MAGKDGAVVSKGTRASIDFTGRTDGVEFEGGKASNFSLTVGETQMIPGFTEQIEGHKAGDKFTIQVKFPEDYHAENLRVRMQSLTLLLTQFQSYLYQKLTKTSLKYSA